MGKAEFQDACWRVLWSASGVRTVGMRSKGFMGTREIRRVQAELVGSDKPKGEEDPNSEARQTGEASVGRALC